jgi:hypothetical protein
MGTVCACDAHPAWSCGPSTSPLAAGMRRHLRYAWPLLVAVTPLHADSGSALLMQLAAELKSMRSLPIGTPTHATCPKDSSALIGLRQQQVRSELADPDYVNSDGSWSYFFTSPALPSQRGGGFPELTLGFDPKGVVAHLSCHYAR